LRLYAMVLDWNESPLSLVPNAVAWTMSDSETKRLEARPNVLRAQAVEELRLDEGSISMKTTSARRYRGVVVLFTGSMRAPTNCVSCRKERRLAGSSCASAPSRANRFAP